MKANHISILIVDDDEPAREVLESFLRDEYRCLTAASAEEAVGLLAEMRFNLVITDLEMPGASGLKLCQIIKQTIPETIVLIVSGMRDKRYQVEARQQGAFDYLTKPVDLSLLSRTIKCALRDKTDRERAVGRSTELQPHQR